jgi:hypothetical protein
VMPARTDPRQSKNANATAMVCRVLWAILIRYSQSHL